jgi:hypothetical protein
VNEVCDVLKAEVEAKSEQLKLSKTYPMMLGLSSCPKDDIIRTAQTGKKRESTCKTTIWQSLSN